MMIKRLFAAAAMAAVLTGCVGQAPADETTRTPETSRPATTVTETAEPTHRPPLDPTETRDPNHPKAEVRAAAEAILGLYQAARWGKAWDGLTRQSRQAIDRETWTTWLSACDYDYASITIGRVQTGNDLAVVRWIKTTGHVDMLMRYQGGVWRLELTRDTIRWITTTTDLAAACRAESVDG